MYIRTVYTILYTYLSYLTHTGGHRHDSEHLTGGHRHDREHLTGGHRQDSEHLNLI